MFYFTFHSFYQGVITDDVVGRPTELRFFYKEQEEANYVVYFPNFNLTKRDPGKPKIILLLKLLFKESYQKQFLRKVIFYESLDE